MKHTLKTFYVALVAMMVPIAVWAQSGACSDESSHDYVNGICTECGAYQAAGGRSGYDIYEIGNAGQLFWFAEQVNAGRNYINAVLTADIDLENRQWTPIGIYSDAYDYPRYKYTGTFDGQNHVIKNLNVHVTDGSEAGLFSRGFLATLRNFGVINATVINDSPQSVRAGVLAGEFDQCTVSNVFSAGNLVVITSNKQKGGIAGECNQSPLTNCYTTYDILTDTNVRSATNCFYLGNEVNASSAGTFMTAEQMASGEMAYKLGNAYGQTIGTDALPVFGGAKVNYGYVSCVKGYTNAEVSDTPLNHNYENGICSVCGTYEAATDSNGDGTYEIANAGQLFWFAEYVNSGNYSARAVLTADIDLDNRPWTPIGYFNDAVDPYIDLHYRGIFDGQNHIIKNLNVHITDGSEAGFFSRTRDASLRNFGIVNATVISDPLGDKSSRAGVVGGELHYTTVDNVYTCGNITVITEYPQKGGIAGESSATRLNNCYTTYGILTPTKDVSVNNCFYLADEANASSAGTAVTAAQMASGEVAYKLGNAYGQTIGSDALPVFGGAKVNYGYVSCVKGYTNAEVSDTPLNHNYENGICSVCGTYEAATDSNGDGTYEIANAGQFFWFAEHVNSGNYSARAVLTADIDLENRPWIPIGHYNYYVNPLINFPYRGIFDGQNHIIKNLYVHVTDGREAGLFCRTQGATLRNFGVVNAVVVSEPVNGESERAGVVAGEIHLCTVNNVYTCGNITVTTEHEQKGGFAGECAGTTLNNCYTTHSIFTINQSATVTNCFYLGNETNAFSAGTFMTAEQMASGEMAYNLGNAYGQTIGTDAYPVLGGAKVNYGYISCTATEKAYSNSEVRETQGHNYIDGVCEHCSDVAEACWGASLERLTSWGTYSEAISAAEAGRAAYVKLNKDVTSVTEIHSGTFTLDVNGHVMRVSDYVLNIKGANVTITDSSDGPVGILHNDNFWHRAIMASNGATVYIEKVQVMGAGAVEVLESSNVTIASGTYSSTDHPTVENKSGTLTILGGTFQTETEATVTSIKSAIRTTISGGTFAEGYDATIIYETGVLDLSGWANPAGISVYTYNDVPLGASTISLPTDYLFFNGEEVAIEVLNPGTKYTIRNAEIFTVAFNANGGTGEMEDVSTYSNYRLPECTFTAPEGLGFKAWLVNEVEYQPNDVITITGNTTITAVWATPYTLAFSANGGVGSLVALKTTSTVTLPECPFLAPEGKEFKAWRIGENEYAAGSVATLTEDAVAYAVWKDALVVHELDVVIFPMLPDAGEGATVRIMRDGIEIDRVEITVAGEPAHCWIPYDSNREYTFYWESRLGDSSWEVDVNIHLGPELIFHEFGYHLEHEYRDRPFLTIPAKSSAGSTLETLNIIDGELPEYNVLREAEVGTLTYQRTLPNQEWNALYLPFEIPLSELEADYEVAYFNDMHSYDRNRDGEIDELEMEIILIDEGTLHANHPYFIRATSDDAKDLELVLNDVTICETENAQLTCSSVYTKFDLNGSYAKKSAAELEGCYAISTEGVWAPLADGTALNPFRFYLEITQLAGSPVKVSSHALKSIRIRLNGQGDTTDIQEVPTTTTDAAVYDLSGRRVVNPGKGVYIVNGKKVMMK